VTKTTPAGAVVVEVCQNVDLLPESHQELFQQRLADADFFTTLAWFRHLAATALNQNQSPRMYSVATDSKAHLVLPLCRVAPSASFLRLRKLTALANFYTPLFEPVSDFSIDEFRMNLAALVRSIAAESPRWDVIDLHPMDSNSAAFNELGNALKAAGMATQRYFCFGNWYLAVNGRTYQEYFNNLPSKLQHTVTRKSRQLEQSHRLHIEIVTSNADLEKSIAAYEAIYRASWKNPEPFPKFIPGLIRLCAEQGSLRLGVAYMDHQPVAAQLWIVHNRIASIYKLAYDEAFTRYSVGSILTSRLMRHVLDVDHVREVDYLCGDEAYKKDWMSHRRERWGIIAFNLRTVRGVMLAFRHVGINYLKTRFR
jgi:hypothetical protein